VLWLLAGMAFGLGGAYAWAEGRRRAAARRVPGDRLQPIVTLRAVRGAGGELSDFVVSYANRPAERVARRQLTGLTLRELAGRRHAELLERGRRVLEDRAADAGTITLRRRAGGHRAIQWNLVPVAADEIAAAAVDTEGVGGIGRDLVLSSEAQFRSLVENSPDVVCVVGVDGRMRYVSANASAVLGQSPERMIGSVNIDYLHPEDIPAGAEAFFDVVQRGPGALVSCAVRLVGDDGTVRWTEITMANRTDDPLIDGLVFNIRDVTERRRDRDALEASEQRYRSIVETTAEMIAVADRELRIVFANRRMAEVTGVGADELIGHYVFGFLDPEAIDAVDRSARAVLRSGEPSPRHRAKMQRPDGSVRWLEGQGCAIPMPDGSTGLLLSVTDVSERVLAQAALEESERTYRTIVEGGTTGLVVTDGLRIGSVSPRLAARLGYDPIGLVGRPVLRLVAPADRAGIIARLRSSRAEGARAVDQRVLRLVSRTGELVWMLCSATSRLDAAAEVAGMAAVFVDITDQRRTEEARRDLAAQIALAGEVERRRLSEDLHDGPVQALSALALRLDTLALRPLDADVLERLDAAARLVRSTIVSLRSLMFELVPPDLDQAGLARAIRGAADVVLAETEVEVELHEDLTSEPDAAIQTVAYRIAQEALTNVRNHASADTVVIDLRDVDGGLRLEVRDDGLGAEPDRLLEERPGHLGLRSVRQRAQEVGGWCEVRSSPGSGTMVEAWLPLAVETPGRFPSVPLSD